MATKKSKDRKYQLADELKEHFDNYSKLFVVEVDNVGSNQLHEIRKSMRGTAHVYCGKNTQMRRVIRELEEAGRPELEKIRLACKLNVAFVFTNSSLPKVRDMILDNKKASQAKAGAVAQCAVTIEKGITSLEPSMTSFLQALNISSKITKGSIEIVNDVKLFDTGDKVDASQAALLQKLDIQPFSYGLIPIQVFDGQSLFEPAVLDIEDSMIVASFGNALKETAAISLGLDMDMPTVASVPYSILLAFANLLAVACETEHSFKEAEGIKAYLADPSAFASAAPAAGAASGGGSAAAAVVEEEEEEEMAPAANLFGDEGDDY
jgi:large subunit ribosomal protein LP0